MKERKTCRCGKVYWVSPPKKGEDALKYELKYTLCQRCRNRLNQQRQDPRRSLVQEVKDDNLKQDIRTLIWLEKNRPDLAEKLRLKFVRKRLNGTNRLSKDRCLVT